MNHPPDPPDPLPRPPPPSSFTWSSCNYGLSTSLAHALQPVPSRFVPSASQSSRFVPSASRSSGLSVRISLCRFWPLGFKLAIHHTAMDWVESLTSYESCYCSSTTVTGVPVVCLFLLVAAIYFLYIYISVAYVFGKSSFACQYLSLPLLSMPLYSQPPADHESSSQPHSTEGSFTPHSESFHPLGPPPTPVPPPTCDCPTPPLPQFNASYANSVRFGVEGPNTVNPSSLPLESDESLPPLHPPPPVLGSMDELITLFFRTGATISH